MSGYMFVGWYLDEDYTEQVQNLNNRTGAVTLYAYFERNVAVSFELNGSSSSVSAVTYTANKASTISSKPTLSKHTFAGWWYVEGETYVGTTLPQGLKSETITLRAMFYNSTTAGLTFDITTEAATIVGHTFTTKTAVTLPTYVGGTVYQVPVVAIAGSAFYQANISTLTWAPAGETSSVASDRTYAFYQSTMTALDLPATLTSIGRGAFGGLSGVTTLTVDAVAGTGTVECPNATTVVLNVDLTSGVLKGFGSVATLTHSGKYSLSYYFGGASSIPSSLTAVHVTGNTVCSAMLTGSQVATVYLDGEMVDLDSFEVLYQYARNTTLSIKVPSSLLSAYQTNYQAYVDELDTLTLS
jgi:uncharacterized repeat protein (TIGR02543 family)